MKRKNELLTILELFAIAGLILVPTTAINSLYAEKPKFDLTSSTGVYCNKLWDQIEQHRKNGEKQQADEKATHYAEVCAPIYGGIPRLSTEVDVTTGPLQLAEPDIYPDVNENVMPASNFTTSDLNDIQGKILTENVQGNIGDEKSTFSIQNKNNTSQSNSMDISKSLKNLEQIQSLEGNKVFDKNSILVDRLRNLAQKNFSLELHRGNYDDPVPSVGVHKYTNKDQTVNIITNSLVVKLKNPSNDSLALQGSKTDPFAKQFSDLATEVKKKGAIPAGQMKKLGVMHVKIKSTNANTDPPTLEINKDTLAALASQSRNSVKDSLMPLTNLKKSLEANPAVEAVYYDSVTYLDAQRLPLGIDRVDGDLSNAKSGDGKEETRADIAILDTGVQFDHPDLNVGTCISFVGNFVDSGDMIYDGPPLENCTDKIGHGTHVAGIAAAKDNSIGAVGIAPGSKIHAIKVCEDVCYRSDILEGLNYVISHYNEIDVVNLSLGGKVYSWIPDYFEGHEPVEDAIRILVNNYNIVVVASAGNDNENAGSHSPARERDAITVSSITDINGGCYRDPNYADDDTFSTFSNHGSVVDLAAPGDPIFSTLPGGNYGYLGGTSMAAPHVSGAAALYIAAHPAATPSEVTLHLLSSGTNSPTRLQEASTLACNYHGRGYFSTANDGDDVREPLLYLGPPVCPPDCKVSDGSGAGGSVSSDLTDYDGDGIIRKYDNCDFVANTDQLDTDKDWVGDACESDPDKDGVEDYEGTDSGGNNIGDNCPTISNRDQKDTDRDGKGDKCDSDIDNDGVGNADDNCRARSNPNQADFDDDGIGDACDLDRDGDGTVDRHQREEPVGGIDDPIM